jgi:phage terminase large subunit-like protein
VFHFVTREGIAARWGARRRDHAWFARHDADVLFEGSSARDTSGAAYGMVEAPIGGASQ